MRRSGLSLKWLEVFQIAARTGSVKAVAAETGLSASTVSHHLRCLDEALGLSLIDHGHRPMVLTREGAVFLRYVDGALNLLSRAEAEVHSGTIAQTRNLRLGLIEDFDSVIAPEMARTLALSLPDCVFRHVTRPSHEILDLVRRRELDLGVATRPQFEVEGLTELPLLRDPFVLVVPAETGFAAEDFLNARSDLPFLRFSQQQIMGTRIETQLRRMRIALPNRFEFESNQSLMGMVAAGGGWATSTPTNFLRAQRFHAQTRMLPFPGKGFSRSICLYVADGCPPGVTSLVSATLRRLIQSRSIDPALDLAPWLAGAFHLAPETEPSPES